MPLPQDIPRSPNVGDCRLVEFRRISDPRGNLTPIELDADLPFDLQRIYFLYETPIVAERGGHAHKALEQILISVSGSVEIHLFDGREDRRIALNQPNLGLFVPNLIWRDLRNFSDHTVLLVLASQKYDAKDYIRDKQEFIDFKFA